MAAEDWMDTDTWDGFVDEDEDGSKRSSVYGVPGRKEPKNWNGRSVRSMDSDHLLNAILFCERKYTVARDTFESCHRFDTQSSVEGFYFESVYKMFPDYKNLREEWERRKRE